MNRYLRLVFVTLLISTALLMSAAVFLFRAERLSFYNQRQAETRFGIGQNDLALIKNGRADNVWVLPGAGYILKPLRRDSALIGFIYLPAFLAILYEINRLAKNHSRRSYNLAPEIADQNKGV